MPTTEEMPHCVVVMLGDGVFQVYGPFPSWHAARSWEDRQNEPFPVGARALFEPIVSVS